MYSVFYLCPIFLSHAECGLKRGAANNGIGAKAIAQAVHGLIQLSLPFPLGVLEECLLLTAIPEQVRQGNTQKPQRRMTVLQFRKQFFGNLIDLTG